MTYCDYRWTTTNGEWYHYCDLPPGHSGSHKCGLCGAELTH